MATREWRGTAAAVAQVDTLTPGGTIEAGDKFKITLTGEDAVTETLSVSATSTTVSQTCVDIVTAVNASNLRLFQKLTAATVGTHPSATAVTLTADTAGEPFYCSVTTTESDDGVADDQTFSRAATTASSGPNDFAIAENWSGNTVPVDSDDVIFAETSMSLLYGLQQDDIELTSLTVRQTFTGYIGQADAPLTIDSTTVTIGEQYGAATAAGSGRINLALGTYQTAVTVHNTAATGVDSGLAPVRITATHASNVLTVHKGKVSVADGPGETSQFATINQGWGTNRAADSDLVIGSGVTLATLTKIGGTCALRCAATTVTHSGGTLATAGSGAITTLTVNGGTVNSNSTGTIGTLNLNGGTVDFSRNAAARTVTTVTLKATELEPSRLIFDSSVVTLTNDIDAADAMTITAEAA